MKQRRAQEAREKAVRDTLVQPAPYATPDNRLPPTTFIRPPAYPTSNQEMRVSEYTEDDRLRELNHVGFMGVGSGGVSRAVSELSATQSRIPTFSTGQNSASGPRIKAYSDVSRRESQLPEGIVELPA